MLYCLRHNKTFVQRLSLCQVKPVSIKYEQIEASFAWRYSVTVLRDIVAWHNWSYVQRHVGVSWWPCCCQCHSMPWLLCTCRSVGGYGLYPASSSRSVRQLPPCGRTSPTGHVDNNQCYSIHWQSMEYKATKDLTLDNSSFLFFNLPMQFLVKAHAGFFRVVFLEHTIKGSIPTSILMQMNIRPYIWTAKKDTNLWLIVVAMHTTWAARLVGHCTGIAEVMGSNPIQTWIFFRV